MASDRSTLIVVAVIGVIGSLGAAAITNPSLFLEGGRKAASEAGNSSESLGPDREAAASPVKTITPPHALEIQLNQSTLVWGEDTKVLEIPPGEEKSVDGRDLFASVATFPQGNCRGPEYIAFTWQVRDPYPPSGDLEVREVFQGGSTQRIGMGAMGSGQMGPCAIRIFKNNGLETTKVELRYASAIDGEPETNDPPPEPAVEEGSVPEPVVEEAVE